MNKKVIFTDLDGSLLDEANYSHLAALPALGRVAQLEIPLIFCSSKTRSEIEQIRDRVGNSHPFVSENGGGIFVPIGYFSVQFDAEAAGDYWLIRFGKDYSEIRARFVGLREQLGARVVGFGDMTIREIADLTGLDEREAELASRRDFDEPFVFDGPVDERLLRAIEASGLGWTQGRIFHILGNHDKGRAVSLLLELYRKQHGLIDSIGLGDGLNDLPMLRAVTRPVLIRHRDGSIDSRIGIDGLIKTQLPGPAGWNEAVLDWLEENRGAAQSDRQLLLTIHRAALDAVDPCRAVLHAVKVEGGRLQVGSNEYHLNSFSRIIVIGGGKATARMAMAIESLLGDRIAAGLIVVKHGHREPLAVIEQVEAAHPVPSQSGVDGTQRILQLAQAADERTLLICLLSGGASALLSAPVDGVTLDDKQRTTQLLLDCGATIAEMNSVRKHLSRVKGGALARQSYPARLLTLIVSDVIGDPLDVIASGPTAADSSTFVDAWQVIEKYRLSRQLPSRVLEYLRRGLAGDLPETVKPGDPCLEKTQNEIVAGIRHALAAAREKSAQLGLESKLITDSLQGEATDAAAFLAAAAKRELDRMNPGERLMLLSGGETTVTVRGAGRGGRNQELALAFALQVEGMDGVSLLSAATDGGDGPLDAAGALVDGTTAAQARSLGIDPASYLADNDSYGFFSDLDCASAGRSHFKTGPSGTNVADIQVMLLTKSRSSH